jgi:hypothetical protein
MPGKCPECGAAHVDDKTCRDDFHKMLEWEAEDPGRLVAHHLMVLGFHLQHPSLYSPEGLALAKQLLIDFLECGKSPQQARKESKSRVSSTNRNWKITSRRDLHGAYARPIAWTMTAADAVAGGADHYCDNVRSWAKSILGAIRLSRNL